MENENTIHIYQLDQDLNLPTCDPECLAVQAYIRFAKIKVKTHTVTLTPFNYEYPRLEHKGETIIGAKAIIQYLQEHKKDMDSNLNLQQLSQLSAFTSLLFEQFYPCLVYYLFETENYDHVFEALQHQTSFLYKLIIPRIYKNHLSKKSKLKKKKWTRQECIERLKECLISLSNMLNNKSFFFGDRPTSLDALVYGFVSCLYYPLDFPEHEMQDLLKFYPSLTKFCDTISSKYFAKDYIPKIPNLNETVSVEQTLLRKAEIADMKKKNLYFYIIAGTSLLFYFYVSNFLIKIRVQDDEDEE